MKDTAEESAELKFRLKHTQVTDEIREEAKMFPLEADEAYFDVVDGLDSYLPCSWVAEQLPQ